MITLRFRFVVPHHRLVLICITGFRSFLGDVSWNSIFCLSLSEAADEVTDWIQIGMDPDWNGSLYTLPYLPS